MNDGSVFVRARRVEMFRILVLAASIGLVTSWGMSRFAEAQAPVPSCRYFSVQAPSANVSKEPRGDAAIIDVLNHGDMLCVTQQQKDGAREWVFVAQKVLKPDNRQTVDGWVNARTLQPVQGPEAENLSKPPAPPLESPLKFDEPIGIGPFPVNGKSIEQLARDVPLFPPIEGLDEAVWKKNCTACHVWDRRALCEQGASYAKNPKSAMRHPHPYGGAYKLALLQWAKSGCQ